MKSFAIYRFRRPCLRTEEEARRPFPGQRNLPVRSEPSANRDEISPSALLKDFLDRHDSAVRKIRQGNR
ncbi:MAG: hypothetical protein ACI4U2_01790 [Christensenellaceae bacterium]